MYLKLVSISSHVVSIIIHHSDYESDIDDFGKEIPTSSIPKEWIDNDEIKLREKHERLRFRRLYGRESHSVPHNDLIEPLYISPIPTSVPELSVQSIVPSTYVPVHNIEFPVSGIDSVENSTTLPSFSPDVSPSNTTIGQSSPTNNTPIPNL